MELEALLRFALLTPVAGADQGRVPNVWTELTTIHLNTAYRDRDLGAGYLLCQEPGGGGVKGVIVCLKQNYRSLHILRVESLIKQFYHPLHFLHVFLGFSRSVWKGAIVLK